MNHGFKTPRDYARAVLSTAKLPEQNSGAPPVETSESEAWWDPWAWVSEFLGSPTSAHVTLAEGFFLKDSKGKNWTSGDIPEGQYALMHGKKTILPSLKARAGNSYHILVDTARGKVTWVPES
jgi:hypothetical protein